MRPTKIAILRQPCLRACCEDRAAIPADGIRRPGGFAMCATPPSSAYCSEAWLAVAEKASATDPEQRATGLCVSTPPLNPKYHPLAGCMGQYAILVWKANRFGRVMFTGPGAGAAPRLPPWSGPDILNMSPASREGVASGEGSILAGGCRWRRCRLGSIPATNPPRNYLAAAGPRSGGGASA